MTLNISSQAQRIIIRFQLMDGSITLNSGEIVCTTKLGCPGEGLALSEIVASPLRPHVGQTKATLAWLGIRAVWAGSSLRRCPNFAHGVVSLCLGIATLMIHRARESGEYTSSLQGFPDTLSSGAPSAPGLFHFGGPTAGELF